MLEEKQAALQHSQEHTDSRKRKFYVFYVRRSDEPIQRAKTAKRHLHSEL